MARHTRSDQVQFDADDDYESGVYDLGSLIQDDLSRGGVRRKRRNPVLLILLVVVVVAIGATAFFLGKNLLSGLGTAPDYAGSGGSQVSVRVNAGDSLSTIANSLHDANVVKSAKAFTNAAAANPKASSIQPGLYALKKQMKAQAALNLLLNPASKLTKRVVIPEGLTVAQTLQKVADGTGATIAALDAALKDVPNLGLPAWMPNKAAVPEGLLGPGTYDFDPSETPLEMVQEMIANFQSTAASINLEKAAAAIGQTPYNVLIIASLIEREAKFDDE
ncbi:MAG: endolytic transglycosylase MltG, partial [Antricoccus sp.]